MQARGKAESFFKGSREKTEDALKEVGDSVTSFFKGAEESFHNIKIRPGAWWGSSGSSAAPQAANPAAARPPPPGAPAAVPTPSSAPPPREESGAAEPPPAPRVEDDAAMRRHFAALERLVEIGLSPQAARVALRHLDLWLVGQEGEAEMAAAEAAAQSAGEPILHVGDRVVLEGLVKNTGVNGKVGMLQAYGADSLRWKVALTDGQVFWVRPKLLKPLELRRRPMASSPAAEKPAVAAAASAPAAAQAAAAAPTLPVAVRSAGAAAGREGEAAQQLEAEWASLQARQTLWKEEQEAREIELLEREEHLRKMHEALEAEREVLGQRRRSMAVDEARRLSQLERESAPSPQGRGVTEFVMGLSPPNGREELLHEAVHDVEVGDEVEAEADEMWDMDWTAVAASRGAEASGAHLPDAEDDHVELRDVEEGASEGEGEERQGAAHRDVDGDEEGDEEGEGEAPLQQLGKADVPTLRLQAAEPASGISPSATSSGSSSAAGGLLPGAVPRDAAALRPSSPRPGHSVLPTGKEVPAPVTLADDEKQALQQKMEEKRRLADLHNGEDLTSSTRGEFNKGRMPGVHPSIAEKLEERRRKLEMEEQGPATEPVPA